MGKQKVKSFSGTGGVASSFARNGIMDSNSQKKKKINSKPKCLNEQEIPYRLREIMKSREEMKNPKKRKKKKAGTKQKPSSEGDIPVPRFRRCKGESESSYMRRMNQETERVLFLTQNQLQREPEKEEPIQEKSQKKKEFQQKKRDKIQKQKEERKIAVLEKDLLSDSIEFGEVALQPPTLTAKPRKAVAKEKLGQKQLLLMPLLGSGTSTSAHKVVHASLARQRIVQEERDRVVQAYRDLKKRKQSAQSHLAFKKLRKPV
ncbi:coiled-coil domain-containing protein 137 [Sphaerodactylus townsendi]|uniref:coiled-coil domain-containing protein 137 n=1 Tax=Sphaerodactylus townsendi TaxID=933632 RepID=UPI002025E9E7|nr:coiled-coil domain-containing protein 137 [Sphaerodactylus townsendi]